MFDAETGGRGHHNVSITPRNDILGQLRIIAGQLTPDEMHALAMFYGAPSDGPGGRAFR
jgi:hypothetical protein